MPIRRHIAPMTALAAAVLTALLMAAPAPGQGLPSHADPSAREDLPDLAEVPAIRFLTTADFPPFNYRDASGELIGFNIDLALAICDVLDVSCTMQAWPWEQVADALTDNQGDALIAGLALTPENGERFDFSSIYLALPGRFVTRNERAANFDPATLANRTVAAREGSTHAAFVRRYVTGAELVEFETEIAALEAVAAGEADAYFGDGMRASFWLNEHLECCSFAGEPYFRTDFFGEGFALAVPAGHDAVREAIDWALMRLMRGGRLDEIYLRWFPVSFY